MSGRTRWNRDGETVTGYRKTDRRQTRRPFHERLRAINLRFAKRGGDMPPIRLAFLLSPVLRGFVASGAHGCGVTVFARGFVRVCGYSAEQCFITARRFLADVARDKPACVMLASIIDVRQSEQSYGRYLIVLGGKLAVAGGHIEPRLYEGA